MNKFKRDNGIDYKIDEVVVSVGGKQSIFNLCLAILEHGDEVIIPAPYWVSYTDIVNLTRASTIVVERDIDQTFKMTTSQHEKKNPKKTKHSD